MDKIKKTNMNIKKITIAMLITLISIGNINAQEMKTEIPKISEFPTGNENTGFEQYFSGKSWLAPLTSNKDLNVPMFNVTFEPNCRNNWHTHTGGQILIAVGGVGYYQERGKSARRLLPGDVVEIAPNVEHWHGASPDSWFSHIAVECNPQTYKNTWLEPVSDEDYGKAVNDKKKIFLFVYTIRAFKTLRFPLEETAVSILAGNCSFLRKKYKETVMY